MPAADIAITGSRIPQDEDSYELLAITGEKFKVKRKTLMVR